MPPTMSAAATPHAPTVGHRKLRFRLSSDVRRHASSGPTAVRNSSSSVVGTITRLKNGGPTVTFVPCTHSDSTGNSVPHNTVKQATRNTRLLNRKLDSRDTSDSSRCSLVRCERLRRKKYTHVANVSARKATNQDPID